MKRVGFPREGFRESSGGLGRCFDDDLFLLETLQIRGTFSDIRCLPYQG
jgi:hypothetical protein